MQKTSHERPALWPLAVAFAAITLVSIGVGWLLADSPRTRTELIGTDFKTGQAGGIGSDDMRNLVASVSPHSSSSDPTVNDDVNAASPGPYAPGNLWVTTTDSDVFVCVDNSDGAAVWLKVVRADSDGDVTINADGTNVGIGDSAPDRPLDISANGGGEMLRLDDSGATSTSDANPYMRFRGDDSDLAYVGFGSAGNSDFSINNALNGSIHMFTNGGLRTTIASNSEFAGPLTVNGSGLTTDAALEVKGTDGACLPPILTTTQRDALTASAGMLIFNSTTQQFEGYNGTLWNGL